MTELKECIRNLNNHAQRDYPPRMIKGINTLLNFLKRLESKMDLFDRDEQINQVLRELKKTLNRGEFQRREFTRVQRKLTAILMKNYSLSPKGYYTGLWMAVGMTSIGSSFGVILFVLTRNPAFLAVGISLGMTIGLMAGAARDKQAQKKGLTY